MAQGQFTKEEARATADAVTEIGKALPKGKRIDFLGHLNDILLFIRAAERAAPFEANPNAVPLEALLACGLEPYRVHPDGAMTALQADTLRLVSEPKSGIVYVLVGGGMVIAELRLDEVAWKGRKAP